MGQTLRTNFALAQPVVRYAPIATEIIAKQRTTLCAKNDHDTPAPFLN